MGVPFAAHAGFALLWRRPTLAKISSTGVENIFLAVVVAYVILVVATENVLVPFLAVLSIASTSARPLAEAGAPLQLHLAGELHSSLVYAH